MALIIEDRVKQATTTTGTGNLHGLTLTEFIFTRSAYLPFSCCLEQPFFNNRLSEAVHRKTSWGQVCLNAMVVAGFAGVEDVCYAGET